MAESNPYVVTSERSSRGLFSSLGGIFNQIGHSHLTGPYDRPPFPIITDKPTYSDVFANMRFSDYVMSGSIYFGGMITSYWLSRPFPSVMQRIVIYHGLSHLFFTTAALALFVMPYRRLTGF